MDWLNPAVLIGVPVALALGGAAGWYGRKLGEDARKQAIEAEREFTRAAHAARDRARAEAEQIESRFRRFRDDHEQCPVTIDELRSTVARLNSRDKEHGSTLAEARTAIEAREAKIAASREEQQAAETLNRMKGQQFGTKVRELEQQLAERNAELARLETETADDRRAHAGCAEVTRRLELRIKELETQLGERDAALADGAPSWLAPSPEGPKDDLTAIRGLGPVLERGLNQLGIFHYAQLAQMKTEDAEWIAHRVHIFPGRIKKDNWADQARRLELRRAGPS